MNNRNQRSVRPSKRIQYVAVVLLGFTLGSVVAGFAWWSLTAPPNRDLAVRAVTMLAPDASVDDVALIHADSMHTGARILEVRVSDVDLAKVTDRARTNGYTVSEDDERVAITTDDFQVRASTERFVIDPHRSIWPAVVQAAAGAICALALAVAVRRRSTSKAGHVLAGAAWGALLPLTATALAAVVAIVAEVPGRPDPAAAVIMTVLTTWWLLVPVGVAIGVAVALVSRTSTGSGPTTSGT